MLYQNKTTTSIRIAIVDNVGKKAGMDYYDLSLLYSLSKFSVKTYLFSNFQNKLGNINVFQTFNMGRKNNFFKVLNFIKGYMKSFFHCKLKKVDVLILHLFSSSFENLFKVILAKIFLFKVLLITHDISSLCEDDSNFNRKVIFNILADKIIVHNQFSFSEISRIVSQSTIKKIHIIKHGNYILFTQNEVTRDYALEKLKLNPDNRYILFFGQIKKVKGLDVLLKAMSFVDENIKLIIAGRPWEDDFLHYQKIIDDLGIQRRIVKYIRYIDNEERDLFFRSSDAIIIPYSVIYSSAVLLMGMGFGLPVIATDLQPIREIIRGNENGILFEKGDAFSLAKKINNLLQDENLMIKIRVNAINTIKNEYSWDKIAEEYMEILT